MKFAICNETFVDWPLDRAFAFARECGYTGLEIAPFTLGVDSSRKDGGLVTDVRQITPAQRAEVCRLADQAGLEIIGLHWLLAKTEGLYWTTPDAAIQRRTADYLGELARLCRDLGGHVMVLGSPLQRNLLPGVDATTALRYAADVVQMALPAFEECDVVLAVEPLAPSETSFLLTAAEGQRLIELIGSPHCRLHLDCKAMSSEQHSIPDLIRDYRGLLTHFHANDANRQGPGFGEVDFVPIFEALGQIDYRGWVSVEVFDYTPGVERLARESIEYMQDCLTRIAS